MAAKTTKAAEKTAEAPPEAPAQAPDQSEHPAVELPEQEPYSDKDSGPKTAPEGFEHLAYSKEEVRYIP